MSQVYTVIISPLASSQIVSCADYIEQSAASPEIAIRWIGHVHTKIQSLSHFPSRFELAEENAHRQYEIRRLVIGKYLALYHINQAETTVRVIAFRHGAQLPRPEELPE